MMVDAIYVWPDGSFVSANVDPRIGERAFRIETQSRAAWLKIPDEDFSVLFPLALHPETGEDWIRKALGFALDLNVHRPFDGIRSSLVRTDRQSDESMPIAPYPRWVDDVRWEGRYEEAEHHVMRPVYPSGRRSTKQWQSRALTSEMYLGCVERLEIYPPEFKPSDAGHPLWEATCSGQTGDPTSLYFHGVVDRLLELELILPISSRRAWEAEHVERGEWRVPDPDQVEVFRLLGEELPWLWSPERLAKWLEAQP